MVLAQDGDDQLTDEEIVTQCNVLLVAANHDPAVYPHPDIFDIERKDTHHQSFGGGAHYCLGAALGRLEAQEAQEAQEALLAIIEHFTTLTMGAKGFEVALTPNLRGLEHLWLRT